MANPLTLYIPIKQDPAIQKAAQEAHDHFVTLHKEQLDRFVDVHYARFVLIPNPDGKGIQAICVITTFDGPMLPYLRFFWEDPELRKLFAGITAMALHPPASPLKTLTEFANFIEANNLSGGSDDLYQAYGQTVRQIKAAFPPSA
ncbi:hypothetical protein AC629_35710 [Bradyrhizobium sp. NAS80.1]|uniref:hypothetical protein n=1 Tax=Bradyrhizobium sp. NAS80.1 TaxID=1680159 RepID=UPI000968C60A|nr:hypothetical protein [Bradyrhizobium sp. NAS80.1]OKO74000.1 hypothetical protein AC629_35710 [Bradyrhizobium sp. NAS80.1]